MNLSAMLPLLTKLPPASARRAVRALLAREAEPDGESLADFKTRAAAAFADDMQPVVTALASALHANDLSALKGLQALLPGLLRAVNRAPALEDLLAMQLGAAFLEGLKMEGGEA